MTTAVPRVRSRRRSVDSAPPTTPWDAAPAPAAVGQRPTVDDAYRHCAEVTRREARNFFWGIRLLPPDSRRAMCAVYALARRIDDIGDDPRVGAAPGVGAADAADAKLRALAGIRGQLATLDSADPVFVALADAARRLPIPLTAFDDLLDGVESDLRGEPVATFDDLVVYCRRVAGSIGRLSLGVYGCRDPRGPRLADALGVALQQTNVLRDVREDHLAGRCYLPADELAAAGVTLTVDAGSLLGGPREPLVELIRRSADRAETWYADGLRLLDLLDRRSAACTAAMAGIYHRLNGRIRREPAAVLDRRLALSTRQKAGVATRALAGAALARRSSVRGAGARP